MMFVAFGCRTTKQNSKKTLHATSLQNLDVKTDVACNVSTEIKTVATNNVVATNNTATKTTITDFSAPDATGKQHPTRQTVIEQTSNDKKVAEVKVNTESKSKSESKVKQADKSNYKFDKSVKTDNKTTNETKTPAWVYVAVFVSSLVLFGLIYLVLKRFGIIK